MGKGGKVEPTRGVDQFKQSCDIYLDGPVVEAAKRFAFWSHEKKEMRMERGEVGGWERCMRESNLDGTRGAENTL